MNSKYILLFAVVALTFSNWYCTTTKLVEEKKQSVQEIKTESLEFKVPAPKVLYHPETLERMKIQQSKIQSFDKVLYTYKNGKPVKVGKISTSTFDKEGVLLETVTFVKNKFEFRYAYKYDADLKRTVTLRFNSKGAEEVKYTYEYNELGLKTKSKRYDKNQILQNSYEYIYDDSWKLIEERWYDAYNKLENKITYDYNLGLKVKSINFKPDGSIDYITQYSNDRSGNLAEELRMDKDGNPLEKIQYVFKYRK